MKFESNQFFFLAESKDPLSKFRGFSGPENPFLKDKGSLQLLKECNALYDTIMNAFSMDRIQVLSSITQRPYNPLPKYIEDNFKELSTVYLEKVNGARDLTICLIVSVLIDNPYIAFIRKKISDLAIQNMYESTWAEAVIAVKCSYSKTQILTFFLERYSFRSIQSWFRENEKTSFLYDQLISPYTKYTLNDNPEVQEQRTIGVGYKDKGASTPEHEKIIEIHDSRRHIDLIEFKLKRSVAFCRSLDLMILEDYSHWKKLEFQKFKSQEEYYEKFTEQCKQERIDSGRKLKPTEGPGKTDRSEDYVFPVKDYKLRGGNNTASGRQNTKKSSDSYFGVFSFEEIKARIYGRKS